MNELKQVLRDAPGRAGGSNLSGSPAPVQSDRFKRLSDAALLGFPVFLGVGLVIYVLPVLLVMLAGGGSIRTFGTFANAFTLPAIGSVVLGLSSLTFAAAGYLVALLKHK